MKNKPLTVEIVDDELKISIGISTLKFAAEMSPDPRLMWRDERTGEFMTFKVHLIDEFVKDVANALENEEEDGTTPLHTLLDNAIITARDEGSLGFEEEPSVAEWA